MSPTEKELRAALRNGEGEPLDPERVIGRARGAVRQRRARVASVAGAVVVVAAVGVWGGLALRPDSKDHNAYSPASGYATRTPTVNPGGPNDASACPASYPVVSTTRPVSGGKLLDGDATAIVVCAYGSSAGAPQNSITLTGAQATALASSLNSAATTRGNRMCPDYQVADATPIAMIATTRTGTHLPVVLTQLGQNPCNLPVTNGQVTRYNWVPPQSLVTEFAQLRSGSPGVSSSAPGGPVTVPGGSGGGSSVVTPSGSLVPPTPPRASGSPAH